MEVRPGAQLSFCPILTLCSPLNAQILVALFAELNDSEAPLSSEI